MRALFYLPRKNRAFKSIYSVFNFPRDSVLETPEIREALAKKNDGMTAAEKVKMIEMYLK